MASGPMVAAVVHNRVTSTVLRMPCAMKNCFSSPAGHCVWLPLRVFAFSPPPLYLVFVLCASSSGNC